MILQALAEYYRALERDGKISAPGWSPVKVSFALCLGEDGTLEQVLPLQTEQSRGRKTFLAPQQIVLPAPVKRTAGVAANFLCDNSGYMLGIDNKGKPQRTRECFLACKELHEQLLGGVNSPAARSILAFFRTWEPEKAAENTFLAEDWKGILSGGNLIFRTADGFAHDDPAIRQAWENHYNRSSDGIQGVCLVTGELGPVESVHPAIKNVAGAQSSGAALVSFNAPAFESYGKEQSYNAPVGKYAEFAYTTALNYMLSQRDDTFLLGDSMIVFWAENGQEEYPKTFSMAMDVKPDNQEIIRGIFANLKAHRPIALDDIQLDTKQNFSILSLAPNAARLSVRFFYQNSFGMILQNISQHYQRMELVKPVWEDRDYLGISQLLAETMNQKSKDKMPVPNMASMVLMAILSGSRYPASLYTDTLIRIRTEQGKVTWGRAAIIKAYLIQNYKWEKGEQYMALNESTKETAYVLGRLFAVLESIQTDASPGVKATIRDRYFNSACATPESVFPVLLKLKNTHIRKIEREKEGLKVHYEIMLAEIMGKLEQFPKRLSLEEQGKFILGYYHQMQKRYEKKEEN